MPLWRLVVLERLTCAAYLSDGADHSNTARLGTAQSVRAAGEKDGRPQRAAAPSTAPPPFRRCDPPPDENVRMACLGAADPRAPKTCWSDARHRRPTAWIADRSRAAARLSGQRGTQVRRLGTVGGRARLAPSASSRGAGGFRHNAAASLGGPRSLGMLLFAASRLPTPRRAAAAAAAGPAAASPATASARPAAPAPGPLPRRYGAVRRDPTPPRPICGRLCGVAVQSRRITHEAMSARPSPFPPAAAGNSETLEN